MEGTRIYPTLYYVDCPPRRSGRTRTSFPSCVRVRPGEDIHSILRSRGLSEKQDGPPWKPGKNDDPEGQHWFSDKLRRQSGPDLDDIHTACFLGFLCLSARVAAPEEILGDCGIVHDLVHDLLDGSNAINGYDRLIDKVRQLESSIPGNWF